MRTALLALEARLLIAQNIPLFVVSVYNDTKHIPLSHKKQSFKTATSASRRSETPSRSSAMDNNPPPPNTNIHTIVKAQIVFLLSTLTEDNFERNQVEIRSVCDSRFWGRRPRRLLCIISCRPLPRPLDSLVLSFVV